MLVIFNVFFWTPLFLIIYSYLGYPIILTIINCGYIIKSDIRYVMNRNERRKRKYNHNQLPSVGVIISAFNEEASIEARIKNLISLDYPREKINFYIGSDGSSDDTNKIVRSFEDSRIVFRDFPENRGKSSVLNDLVASSTEEILIFSDANTYFERNAIQELVRHFTDKDVHGVCGELHLIDSTNENQDGIYWKLERYLKFCESRLNALLGANGAIYAIRKASYSTLPDDTITDDFTVMLKISSMGHKVLYDSEAKAIEETAPASIDEYRRRVRIGAGNYQAFSRFINILHPRFGWLCFSYFSHKVLRWFTPHFLAIAFFANLLLVPYSKIFIIPLIMQISVYSASYYLRNKSVNNKLLNLAIFWVHMNVALGHGFIRYLNGNASGKWERTNR